MKTKTDQFPKTEIAVDTCLYFAKAGLLGNPWRTPHVTRETAIKQARYFVRSWMEVGIDTYAVVFYRDGSVVQTVTANDLRRETVNPLLYAPVVKTHNELATEGFTFDGEAAF